MSSTSNLRKRLDALIQNGKTVKRSAETTLAWRSLQMAKAWLGRAASYQGNGSIVDTARILGAEPYLPTSAISSLPPTSDVATETFTLTDDHLANINAMRDAIQAEIDSIENLLPAEERQRHCYRKSLDNLTEANMWYGFELQEIRERELNPDNANAFSQRPATPSEAIAGAKHVDGISLDYIIPEAVREESTPLDGGSVLDEAPANDASTAGLLDAKISEDENKDSKKEQQGTSGKKR